MFIAGPLLLDIIAAEVSFPDFIGREQINPKRFGNKDSGFRGCGIGCRCRNCYCRCCGQFKYFGVEDGWGCEIVMRPRGRLINNGCGGEEVWVGKDRRIK